jgi:hypothetical protein
MFENMTKLKSNNLAYENTNKRSELAQKTQRIYQNAGIDRKRNYQI